MVVAGGEDGPVYASSEGEYQQAEAAHSVSQRSDIR